MTRRQPSSALLVLWITLGCILKHVPEASAGPVFLGPSPYLSFSDSPFSNTNGSSYFYLETFEDGAFDAPGATPSSGWVVAFPGPYTDSVDADDGAIDGAGTNGHSLYSSLTASNLTATFSAGALAGRLPTHAGIVCTDVGQVTSGTPGFGNVTFSARDSNGALLGSITKTNFGNGSAFGSGFAAMAEDRFFGARAISQLFHFHERPFVPFSPLNICYGRKTKAQLRREQDQDAFFAGAYPAAHGHVCRPHRQRFAPG